MIISKLRCFICLDESQIVNSGKKEKTLPEYGDRISSEIKVLYKKKNGNNSLEKLESTSFPNEAEGINYFILYTIIFVKFFKNVM